jgi:CMP-N,N'-diacetyllegionaminic acid synthase
MKKPKIIAIIPARGGSKGLPKKNIKILAGKPLIAWTIEQAKKSKLIDELIVNTDSQEIAKIAQKYGAKVPFIRPKNLAQDNSSVYDVIFHTLDWYKKNGLEFEIVVLLEPTSPLRKEGDIDKAINLFLKNYKKAESLVGIGETHADTGHPYGSKKINKAGFLEQFIKHNEIYQRQKLPKVYSIFGGIYISKVNAFKKWKTFYWKRTIPYLVERWQNYEIDDIYDFICVEAILKIKSSKKYH